MRFKNNDNGYIEKANNTFVWTFLFGPFYFLYKGAWQHCCLWFLLGFVITVFVYVVSDGTYTGVGPGIFLNLTFCFFAQSIIRKHYLRKGWTELEDYTNRERRK